MSENDVQPLFACSDLPGDCLTLLDASQDDVAAATQIVTAVPWYRISLNCRERDLNSRGARSDVPGGAMKKSRSAYADSKIVFPPRNVVYEYGFETSQHT